MTPHRENARPFIRRADIVDQVVALFDHVQRVVESVQIAPTAANALLHSGLLLERPIELADKSTGLVPHLNRRPQFARDDDFEQA